MSNNNAPRVFEGTVGADLLIGMASGENEFRAGVGNDGIAGFAEADTYIFNRGDGHDRIRDNGDANRVGINDRIVFGAGITLDDIRLTKGDNNQASNITLTILQNGKAAGDSLTLIYGSQAAFAIEQLVFSDGSTVNVADIPEYSSSVFEGTNGDDNLTGTVGHDNEFRAGAGNDVMTGYAETDTYLFNRGDSQDQIRDNGDANRTEVSDRIVFGDGITLADIKLTKGEGGDASNITLTILQNGIDIGDSLTLIKGGQAAYAIETLEFSDGTTVPLGELPDSTVPVKESLRIETTITGDDSKIEAQGSQSSATMDASDLISLDAFRQNGEFSHIDGSGYAVVVIDSGFDLDHPFFGPDSDNNGISDRIVYQQDFTDEGDGSADSRYSAAHGTNVASITASSDSQYDGIAPGADIIVLQVLTAQAGQFGWLEKALQWVVDNADAYNIAAVNMSLGDGSNGNALTGKYGVDDQLARLEQQGVITVASAGNSYGSYQREGAGYPAIDPSTIAVGAVFDAGTSGQMRWSDVTVYNAGADRLTPFTQRSTEVVDIFAPGATIYGAAPGGGVGGMTGTSQAAPVVTGAAVLAQQLANEVLGRSLTMDEFNTAIRASAVTITDGDDESDSVANTGKDYFRIDIEAMGQYIKAMAGGESPAPVVDDGNESISEAVSIAVGADHNGDIEVSFDKDWYSLSLEAGVKYTFSMTGQTLSDPFLSLHAASGTAIADNDNSNGGRNSEIVYTPSKDGLYYLNAQASWDGTGTYKIGVTGVAQEIVNDIAGDSTTTAVLTDSQSSTIDFGGDKDWFKVSLQTGNSYTFDVKGVGAGTGTLADGQVSLFTSSGQLVGFDDDSGAGADASLVFQPSSSGDYYVEVAAYDNSELGSYTVQMTTEQLGTDIADDLTTKATLTVGSNVDGEINFASDQDWYAITLEAGMRYQFDLKGSASNKGSLADPFLALHSPAGVSLVSNDDVADSTDSQLVFTAEQAGTYYLSAGAFGNEEGTYNLSAQALEPELPGEPDPVTPGEGVNVSNPYPINIGWNIGSILRQQGEVDWYSVQLVAGEKYQFDLQADANIFGAQMQDPLLYLYDPTRSPLSEDDNSGAGLDSLMTFTAQTSGTYYLGAASAVDGDSGAYTLRTQLLTSTQTPPDGGEKLTVTSPYAIAVGSNLLSNLVSNNEVDWYSIVLEAGKSYKFDLESTDYLYHTGIDDPLMHLYDSSQNAVTVDDNSGTGNNSALEFTATTSGTYYLGATSVQADDTGTYTLRAHEIIDYTQVRDENSITSNSNVYSSLSNDGEIDWYALQLTAGQNYRFEAKSSNPYTSSDISDPMLYLYDTSRNPLLEDDNSGQGSDALLSYTPTTSGIYFIGVGSVVDDDLGGYGLHTSIV